MVDADPREALGRIVNETRRAFAAEQADERGDKFFIQPWEHRAESQRELDMRIGAAVAVQAVADAGLRNERLELEVATLQAHLPAILGALRAQVANAPYASIAKPYKAALVALRGSDEKEEQL